MRSVPVVGKRANEKVMIGFPCGQIEPHFMQSMVFLLVHDAQNAGHVVRGGAYLQMGTTNLPHARNQIVRQFLDNGDWDWLWFVDTDQTFPPDVLDRMLAAADPDERPILGALVFSLNVGDAQRVVPTMWHLTDDDPPLLGRVTRVPRQQLVELHATGTGCVLIHRKVFEAVRDLTVPGGKITFGETSWPWFQYSDWVSDIGPDVMGEDLTFFIRASAAGFTTTVDTTIEVGHVKRGVIGLNEYLSQPLDEPAPSFVVIPVKGRHDLTDKLVRQLQEQGQAERIIILDNGADTDPYLNADVKVIPSAGKNIHEMWNTGIAAAIEEAPRCNIAILNNDLEIGSHFLTGLEHVLRSNPRILAVSPNYDGRRVEDGFQPVRGICARKYDGTGGLAGFAFMVKGEMFANGFPFFDEKLQWWFGDNELTLHIEEAGGVYGIATGTTVVHVDGGGQTGTDAEFAKAIEEDRAYFMEKWQAKIPEA